MAPWTRRAALRAAISQPNWIGIGVILVALAMHIVGEFSALFMLSQVGFVIALSGVVLAIGGYSLLKVVSIPIIFLIFAVPLPYFIEALLSLRLQLISSELGAFFLRIFGFRFISTEISLTWETTSCRSSTPAAACDTSILFSVSAFWHLICSRHRFLQHALVFLSGIPIAIGMNGFRIGLVAAPVDR